MPRYIAAARRRIADKLRQELDQAGPMYAGWLRRMFAQGGFEREVDEQSIAEARGLLGSIDLNRYNARTNETDRTHEAYWAIIRAREALAEAELAVVQLHWARSDGDEPRPRVGKYDPVRLAMQRTGSKP